MKKTASEAELRARVKRGESTQQIADDLGVTPSQMYAVYRVLGINGPRLNYKPAYVDKLVSKLHAGASFAEAARFAGVKYITAYQYCKRNGLLEKQPSLKVKQ